ncbi:ankyrin repeat domain-containing protein [bacterium]|jgi:hypothetical protein|nr:ankyrin repeat domain-containing protein [bacterium]
MFLRKNCLFLFLSFLFIPVIVLGAASKRGFDGEGDSRPLKREREVCFICFDSLDKIMPRIVPGLDRQPGFMLKVGVPEAMESACCPVSVSAHMYCIVRHFLIEEKPCLMCKNDCSNGSKLGLGDLKSSVLGLLGERLVSPLAAAYTGDIAGFIGLVRGCAFDLSGESQFVFEALDGRQLAMFTFLLNLGTGEYGYRGLPVNLNAQRRGIPLLHLTVAHGDGLFVRALIDARSLPIREALDLDKMGFNDDTALHVAADEGDDGTIATILIRAGADKDAVNEDGNTPLHCAAIKENVPVALALIANEAKIEGENEVGDTPLHLATQIICEPIVRALVGAGADVNKKNEDGQSAIDIAHALERPLLLEALGVSE